MIDPPKATKGRRMSKKTPKKTTKAASARTARAQSVTSTKKLEAQTRMAKAGKSGKKSTGKTGKAIGRASQKAASKQLKSSGSRRPMQLKAAAVRPADNSAVSKSPAGPNHPPATPLVSDEQHKMLEAYGVWGEKSMYGKTFHGVLRTTVLIGANGRILKIWRNVKVDGHADQVLAEVRAL